MDGKYTFERFEKELDDCIISVPVTFIDNFSSFYLDKWLSLESMLLFSF